jgi:glycosyltransferase involved in cell wall biosynthesis
MSQDVCIERPHVLFFGRIVRYKGLDYLIKAAPIVCERIPEAKIVVAGAGPDWPRCKDLIQDPNHFILHEKSVYDPDVTKLFEEAAVVVLPYIEASQSGVLNIAYAMGKPVIATNVGSLPEIVNDNVSGLIVPPGDHQALANAIVKLLSDDPLRKALGAKGYEKATIGDLSWDNIAIKTADVYTKTIGHRKH